MTTIRNNALLMQAIGALYCNMNDEEPITQESFLRYVQDDFDDFIENLFGIMENFDCPIGLERGIHISMSRQLRNEILHLKDPSLSTCEGFAGDVDGLYRAEQIRLYVNFVTHCYSTLWPSPLRKLSEGGTSNEG